MTRNLKILIFAWPFLSVWTSFLIFSLRRLYRAKELCLKKHQIILLFLMVGMVTFGFLPEWPEVIRRTLIEYQYRFEGGPDPETIFHDAEAERLDELRSRKRGFSFKRGS